MTEWLPARRSAAARSRSARQAELIGRRRAALVLELLVAACMTEAIGLKTVTSSTPMRNAPESGGARNCQAEMPAARATTSSLLRVRRQNAIIVPKRIAKGMTCCACRAVSARPFRAEREASRPAACRRGGSARHNRAGRRCHHRRKMPRTRGRTGARCSGRAFSRATSRYAAAAAKTRAARTAARAFAPQHQSADASGISRLT